MVVILQMIYFCITESSTNIYIYIYIYIYLLFKETIAKTISIFLSGGHNFGK